MFGLLNTLDFDQIFSTCGPNLFYSSDHPRYEQWVEGNKLFIEFALAGYKKENLYIEQVDDLLVVGAKKQEDKSTRRLAARSFKVKFTNPRGQWNFNKIIAIYEDGILKLEVPLVESKQPTQITIQ